MKVGEYLYCIKDKRIAIRSVRDAKIIKFFDIEKHQKFLIININDTTKCVEIKFKKGASVCFSLHPEEMNDFPGFEYYRNNFAELQEYKIISRKEKLEKINHI